MKEAKNQIFMIGLKLCIVCAVSAVSLGALNEATEPAIFAQRAKEEAQALNALVPPNMTAGQKVRLEEAGIVQGYYPLEKDGQILSYILDLKGLGYGGDMKLMAAIEADGTIIAVRLLDNLETPGLGKKAEAEGYMDKFLSTGTSASPVPISKEMLAQQRSSADSGPQRSRQLTFGAWFLGDSSDGDADSISGATITFLGVAEALAAGSEYARTHGGAD